MSPWSGCPEPQQQHVAASQETASTAWRQSFPFPTTTSTSGNRDVDCEPTLSCLTISSNVRLRPFVVLPGLRQSGLQSSLPNTLNRPYCERHDPQRR